MAGFSSFKNAEKAHRRAHKERAQPASRKRFGLLEKKKDYKHRARDYHIKQKRLQVLQEKARNRNPDEFYYGMINSRMKDGVHFQENKIKAPEKSERIRALCRDLFQIESERMRLAKEIEQMHVSLSLMPGMPDHPERKHVVFMETAAETRKFNRSAEAQAEYFDTHPALLDNPSNRLTLDQLASTELESVQKTTRKKAAKRYESKVKEITEAKERMRKLDQDYVKITEQKNRLSFKRKRRPLHRGKNA